MFSDELREAGQAEFACKQESNVVCHCVLYGIIIYNFGSMKTHAQC